jgi:hypothetical protein
MENIQADHHPKNWIFELIILKLCKKVAFNIDLQIFLIAKLFLVVNSLEKSLVRVSSFSRSKFISNFFIEFQKI